MISDYDFYAFVFWQDGLIVTMVVSEMVLYILLFDSVDEFILNELP